MCTKQCTARRRHVDTVHKKTMQLLSKPQGELRAEQGIAGTGTLMRCSKKPLKHSKTPGIELRTEQGIAGAGRHQASIAFGNRQRQVQSLDHQATGGSKEEGNDEPACQYTQRLD